MLIKVKVFSNARKEEVVRKSSDSFEVRVKVKPLQGEANRSAAEALADYFNLSASRVRLIKGFRQTNKVFSVSEIK